MRWIFVVVIAIHGLIHLLGAAKGLGVADVPQLTTPIGRGMGIVWLSASLLMLASLAAWLAAPRLFWIAGAVALAVSELAIVTSWHDARFGTIANVVLVVAVVYSFLTVGPTSFRAEYEQAIRDGLAHPTGAAELVGDHDVARLPTPVQRYLHYVGAVRQPRVRNYRLRFVGRIRSGPDAPWMPFEAEQQSFVDPPARLFLMHASVKHLPVEAFHELVNGHATMRVRAAGAVTIVEAAGPVMDRSEAVTLFNDMCLLAPATLIDPTIRWEAVDERSARGYFTMAGQTISALLQFDEEGRLVDFISDDRAQLSPDGKSFTPLRFSTPVSRYGRFGSYRSVARAEARWHPPAGAFAYGDFEIVDAQLNVR